MSVLKYTGQTWEKLFPDGQQRDLVQRLNRTDSYLYPEKTLAVRKDLKDASFIVFSPFPLKIKSPSEKPIVVSPLIGVGGFL